MKKMAIVSLMFLSILSGCSCNQAIMDFDYEYNTALINCGGEWKEYKIKKWDDYDNDTICIWTEDGQIIYTHFSNVVMFKD